MEVQKPIGRGRSATVFGYGQGRIVKLYNPGFPKPAIELEFRISRYVWSRGLKTPEPIQLIEDQDRLGIVFEQVSSASLLGRISSKPWSFPGAAKLLARLQHSIHQLPAPNLPSCKERLSASIPAATLLTAAEKNQILGYLETLSDGDRLCHGDFHPDNILVDQEPWIIDWMTGASGNPAADVARTVLLLSFGSLPEGTPRLVAAIAGIVRSRLETAYFKCYLQLSGIDHAEVEQWLLPVAAARLVEGLPEAEKKALVQLIRARL